MSPRQRYTAPATSATPTLPLLIERLQNIHLLDQQTPAGNYAVSRSIDELIVNLTDVIGRLDSRILEATKPACHE